MELLTAARVGLCAAALCAFSSLAGAVTVTTFGTLASFQSSTGATSASGPLPTVSGLFSSTTVGSVTFSAPSALFVNWSTVLAAVEAGGVLAISDGKSDSGSVNNDGVDATFAAPVYSAGYVFHEPGTNTGLIDGCNLPCANSEWLIRLKSGSLTVASVNWVFPKDQAAFVGVWSDTPFDKLEIREVVGTDDNEFYGQFYTGIAANVPEPGSAALLGAGAVLLGALSRRRLQNTQA